MTKVALLSYSCGKFSDPSLEFAPRWIAHHSKLFDSGDMYVVGNQVRKRFFKDINYIPRDHPEKLTFDVFWEMATTYEALVRLRLSYHVVIFTSMDEFLCTQKPVEELINGIDSRDPSWVPCQRIPTFDVIHDPFNEPPIDLKHPTFCQRSWWRFSPGSTHPAIFYSSLAPALGWHSLAGIEPRDIPYAYGAVLAHLKREDFEMLQRRNADRQTWRWGVAKDMPGLSEHSKMKDDGLATWFFQDVHEVESLRTDWLEVP